MQQVFFDLYQLLQICDENDIFIVYSRYCCHAYIPNLQYGFLCTEMLCFTYQIKKKSSKYEWTYWTLFCVTFIVMSSWK